MFSLAVLALASLTSSAHALAIPRSDVPATYAEGYLEKYSTYHTRYIALGCENQHSTAFFDDCCHPMLATENLQDNRKAYCTPSEGASSSAAQAEPTSTVVPSGDDDCDDDDDNESSADPTPTPAAPPAKNVAPAPSADPAPAPAPPAPKPAPPAPKPAPSPPKPKPSSGDNGNNGGSGLGGIFDNIIGSLQTGGIATFFFQNGVAGNCGQVHQDSDNVVALPTSVYGNGEHCGKKVALKDSASGHTEVGVVADSCPTCKNDRSVDMSHSLFNKFADDGQGIFDLEWAFME